jgi:hypothetical protein
VPFLTRKNKRAAVPEAGSKPFSSAREKDRCETTVQAGIIAMVSHVSDPTFRPAAGMIGISSISVLRTNCLHQIHDPASHIGVFNLRE